MLKNEKSANRNDHQNRKTEVFCNKNRKTDLKNSQNRKTENPNAPLFYIRGDIVRLLDSNSVFSALNFRSHQEVFSGLSVINCHVCLERSLEDVC